MRRCVWYRNLKNEEAMVRVGPQRHKKKTQNMKLVTNKFKSGVINLSLNLV